MIHAGELRIGNRVFWKPQLSNTTILIEVEIICVLQDKVGHMPSHLEHRVEAFEDDVVTKETPFAFFEELIPIPITDAVKNLDTKIDYPKWIRYLHELQNCYYWEHGKKELELSD